MDAKVVQNEIPAVYDKLSKTYDIWGKLILVNITDGECFGSGIYRLIYRLAPKAFGGCRGVKLSTILAQHGFEVASREYYQQLWFPSEVILARL